MRLVTYARDAQPRLGVERPDGRILPAHDLGAATTIEELLAGGDDALATLRNAVAAAGPDSPALAQGDVRILAPVPRPGKLVAIGLNYHDHAAEGGRAAPPEPMLFAKLSSCVVGQGETVAWDPALTASVDLEAELGVVIGRSARRVSAADALGHVLGYTCVNDVSARDLQTRDGQFVRAKSLDTFGPMGPVIVTTDEIPDPQTLAIRSYLGDRLVQDSNTSHMIFGVAALVAHCSRAFTLEPGDVIATGTPAGVLAFRHPPERLQDGDVMTIEIEGIGRLTNPCRETPQPS